MKSKRMLWKLSIKLPRANVKDQNPHTQKRQIDVKRGNMSMDGSPKPMVNITQLQTFN